MSEDKLEEILQYIQTRKHYAREKMKGCSEGVRGQIQSAKIGELDIIARMIEKLKER